MLSADVLTNFRGRGDEVRVWPLSFAKFLPVWPEDPSHAWREYPWY